MSIQNMFNRKERTGSVVLNATDCAIVYLCMKFAFKHTKTQDTELSERFKKLFIGLGGDPIELEGVV